MSKADREHDDELRAEYDLPALLKGGVDMTVREVITRRKRAAGIVAYSGFALFVLGMVLGAGGPPWL